MSKCMGVHGMFSFVVPVDICFYCAKDSKMVLFDELTGVLPFAPIFVDIDSPSVLEADAESGWEIVCWDWDKVITPSGCGYGYVLGLWIVGRGVRVGR